MSKMSPPPESKLISSMLVAAGAGADQAATTLVTSAGRRSRRQTGYTQPKNRLEDRPWAMADGPAGPIAKADGFHQDTRPERREEAISEMLHALREEFHRTASVCTRQEVLDLVAALFFAHVASIDHGGRGIGEHLRDGNQTAASALNRFMVHAFDLYLPVSGGLGRSASGL